MKNLGQLIAEFSHYISNFAMQSIQALRAKDKSSDSSAQSSDSYKGTLYKTSYGVFYEFLQTPTIPEFLDYNRIICSLCTIMEQIYKKFLDESWFRSSSSTATTALVQAIQDIDSEFKHNFFGLLSRDITALTQTHLRRQTESFQKLASSMNDQLPPLFGFIPPSSTEPSESADASSSSASAPASPSSES